MKIFQDRDSLVKQYSNGRVLDVGCAAKRFNIPYSIGVDIVVNPNVDIRCDVHFLPFRENTFDTVIAGELIEHLKDPSLVISEAKRVLKPKSTLIITTPNPWSITYVMREFFGLRGSASDCYDHKGLWDIKLLRRLLEAHGLKVSQVGYVAAYRNPILKMLVRLNPRWGWHVLAIAKKPNDARLSRRFKILARKP